MSQELESKSLPAHVTACSERYKTIFHRLKRIEKVQWAGLVALIGLQGTIILALLKIVGGATHLPP